MKSLITVENHKRITKRLVIKYHLDLEEAEDVASDIILKEYEVKKYDPNRYGITKCNEFMVGNYMRQRKLKVSNIDTVGYPEFDGKTIIPGFIDATNEIDEHQNEILSELTGRDYEFVKYLLEGYDYNEIYKLMNFKSESKFTSYKNSFNKRYDIKLYKSKNNISVKDIKKDDSVEEAKETWKDVRGFEGLYKVSNEGRVKSLNTKGKEKILTQHKDPQGYNRVCLLKDGIYIKYRVNKLMSSRRISKKLIH